MPQKVFSRLRESRARDQLLTKEICSIEYNETAKMELQVHSPCPHGLKCISHSFSREASSFPHQFPVFLPLCIVSSVNSKSGDGRVTLLGGGGGVCVGVRWGIPLHARREERYYLFGRRSIFLTFPETDVRKTIQS